MKHFQTLTKSPRRAEEWQDFVCYSNQFVVDLMSTKQNFVPFLAFVEGKCDIPEAT